MTDKKLEFYRNVSIEELEDEVNKLYNQKMNIVKKLEAGKIKEDYAQELYTPISEKWSELYRLLEKRKAERYEAFVSCFR